MTAPLYNIPQTLREMDCQRGILWHIALNWPHRLEGHLDELESVHSLLGKVIERVKRHSEREVA